MPGALIGFKGRLLAGIETTVRLYDMGKRKLLRKCEHRKCARYATARLNDALRTLRVLLKHKSS